MDESKKNAATTEGSVKSAEDLAFDEFCARCCGNCRIVRWLGNPSPPDGDSLSVYREWTNGEDTSFFEACPLCRQFKEMSTCSGFQAEFVELELTKLDRLYRQDGHQTDLQRPYDVLNVVLGSTETIGTTKQLTKELSRFGLLNMQADYNVRAQRVQPLLINYHTVRTWFDHCIFNHSASCKILEKVPVPGLRVIDCTTGDIVPLPEQSSRYAALSYVWGELRNKDLEYPRTIKDSIKVTRQMGLDYLWVDRYVCTTTAIIYLMQS